MPTRKKTISVRLDDDQKKRVERAARIRNQSAGAFLERAGADQARQVLISWALDRHRTGEASFSELAQETGLAIEELMRAAGERDPDQALELFLRSARSFAEFANDPNLVRLSEDAVRAVKHARQEP